MSLFVPGKAKRSLLAAEKQAIFRWHFGARTPPLSSAGFIFMHNLFCLIVCSYGGNCLPHLELSPRHRRHSINNHLGQIRVSEAVTTDRNNSINILPHTS